MKCLWHSTSCREHKKAKGPAPTCRELITLGRTVYKFNADLKRLVLIHGLYANSLKYIFNIYWIYSYQFFNETPVWFIPHQLLLNWGVAHFTPHLCNNYGSYTMDHFCRHRLEAVCGDQEYFFLKRYLHPTPPCSLQHYIQQPRTTCVCSWMSG